MQDYLKEMKNVKELSVQEPKGKTGRAVKHIS